MFVRLNSPVPAVAKLFVKPGWFGKGKRLMISRAATSILFAGIVLFGKGVRNAGFGLEAGSKTVMPAPVKFTLPCASGRKVAGATLAVVPAAFRCVVRSRSVKKQSLFLPNHADGPPSPNFGSTIGPLNA